MFKKKKILADEPVKEENLGVSEEQSLGEDRKSRKEKKGKKKKDKKAKGSMLSDIDDNTDYIFDTSRKNVKELVAPGGINPNPLEYMTIDDCGRKVYVMCMYIHKLPNRAKFADTFSALYNVPGVTASTFIIPLTTGKASRQLDKRVLMLDTEEVTAQKDGDTNKLRKISRKKSDAEKWAEDVETGENRLFEVRFLFSIYDESLDGLNKKVADFYAKGKEKGVELCACYSVHPEAYLSSAPTNRIYALSNAMVRTTTCKKHIMDKRSLCTIFNHTRSHFSHKNGVIVGYNLHTGQPFFYDVYDASHNGFGVIFCGKTGTGKSATIKMLCSRYIDFGYKIVSIDFDSVGTIGEYSMMAYMVGGVTFQIKSNSKHIINLFELDVEMEYDEITGLEYPVLNLMEKIADMKHIILTMIKNGRDNLELEIGTFIEDIVTDIVGELYEERGIYDQDVESLYTVGEYVSAGKLTTGKVKKELPAIKDFFVKALKKEKENTNSLKDMAHAVIISAMKHYVRELYYCVDTIRVFSAAEYEAMDVEDGKHYYVAADGEKHKVERVKGTKAYFDGQSTVKIDASTPMVNIDISQLPKDDKPVAQQISLNYIQENFIKKNSVNPNKVQHMIMLVDEAHKMFPYYDARVFLGDCYRTARKHHVSPWTCTQAFADFKPYEETKAIVKNSTSKFLLKQDFTDKEFLQQFTPLTDSEVDELLSLGGDPSDDDIETKDSRKGEVCLIDNDRTIFLKVHYLKETEARVVETDAANRQKLYESMSKGA